LRERGIFYSRKQRVKRTRWCVYLATAALDAECPMDVRLATTGAQAENKTPSSRSGVFNFEELDAGGYLSESILSVS
ncbi:hypothetical protein, partial [Robinsoniella sp.]|uniref:hypothetical protein n=1 Tax=Robinsoniella sp. TaxID=2496533 RepID=UPI003751062D